MRTTSQRIWQQEIRDKKIKSHKWSGIQKKLDEGQAFNNSEAQELWDEILRLRKIEKLVDQYLEYQLFLATTQEDLLVCLGFVDLKGTE